MKTSRFWLAVIFGAALGLTCYQEVLTRLWHIESLRLKLVSCAALILFIVICFYFLEIVIHPRFMSFTKSQKTGVILLAIFTPIVLAIAILDKGFLEKTVYFLLPDHTIQVEAPAGDFGNLALTGIYTQSQGSVSFSTLKMKGWERKGNEIVLTNPSDNQLTWKGKTGDKITLTFKVRNSASGIKVYWDSAVLNYNISSSTEKNNRISKQFDVPPYAGWIPLAVAAYLSVVFAVLSLSVILTAFSGKASPHSSNWAWLIYALPMYVVWLFYLLVFWPGFMSRDAMGEWQQVVTGNLVHAVPVGHTLTVWLITRFWFSPAAVSFVQIMALGGILGWGIATLREFGAPNWLAWLTCIALAVSPANSAFSITFLIDILFSAVVVALTIILFKIVATNGTWLEQKPAWLLLGITLTLVSLYRRNGFFVSLISPLFVILVYKKHWKSILKAFVLFLAIYFLFTGPVYRILNIKTPSLSTQRSSSIAMQILAEHMNAGTFIAPEDKKILMLVLDQYPWPYNCYRNEQLFFYSPIDHGYAIAHSSAILSIALKVTLENPLVTLQYFSCQGASVYRIPEEYHNERSVLGIIKNSYGLRSDSKLPGVYPHLLQFQYDLIDARSRDIIWFVWRMPFWMYLSVFGCIIFCMRNKTWKPLLILLPGLATVLPYLIVTLGQIFRYVYSMYLIGILLSGYFLISPNFSTNQRNENTADK